MEYESIFSFLEGKRGFDDIFKLCIQFEKSIVNQCFNSALMTGRVISEMLLIKLGLKDDSIRENLLIKRDSVWEIKRDYGLEALIKRCYSSKENLIDKDIKEDYFSIKKLGNSNAHSVKVSKYGITHCKEMHELLFDVASDCFIHFFDIDIGDYYYNLDKININKRFTSDEVFYYLNNIHENEINTENFIEYISEKKIFITHDYFDDLIHPYRDYLLDKGGFETELKKCHWIDDSNIKIFLDYFDSSKRKELFSKFTKISERNLNRIIDILHNQSSYLTINEIDKMVENEDESNKLYYEHLKKLSDSFFSDYLNGIINELKSVLVKEKDEETEEIINKLKNYKTDYDDYGFTITQVDKNIFLDDEQKEAAEYEGNKPLVINAGPGSGKTRVITERVRFFVEELDVDPSSILVITFTNEATNEIKNRLKYETNLDLNVVNQMRISTIHSFCRYLISKYEDLPYNYLNRHGERSLFINKYKHKLGFIGPYSISGSDLPSVLDKYDHYFSFGVKTDELLEYISQKDKITDDYLDFVSDFAEKTKGKFPTFNQLYAADHINAHYYAKYFQIAKSYPKYEELLEEKKACDDNYLLKKGCKILSNYETEYTHVLIDEFQDTDYYLKRIIDKLKDNSERFTIVGDLDQSIYGFRGAIPNYFKEYIENKNENKVVELQTNYRSSRDIVEFTEEFIKNIRDDEDEKQLKPKKQYGSPVYHLDNPSESEEFRDLIYIIKNLKKYDKIKYYSDILVLFKSHSKINDFVKELDLFDIPYFIDNKKDFLDQNEIKAILTLYWYLLDYDEYNLQYNKKKNDEGNNFLCLYGFTDKIYDSSDFFKLSEETKNILNEIQEDYESKLVEEANNSYFKLYQSNPNFKYADIFDQDLEFVEDVVNNVKKENLIELDDVGLIKLGITNKNDRKFFLKLKNLKSQMNNENINERPTTLKLFKEFITMTNFYSEISLKNVDDAIKINKDISLLSNIIRDYENIMGNRNYYGLFNYLNGVLKAYSSSSNELEEEMDKVHVRTIHNSKGLEYPVVIIGSLGRITDNKYYSFPAILSKKRPEDKKTIDSYPFQTPVRFLKREPDDFISFHNQEEYRKIYVGATRAKEILILSTIGEIPGFINRIKRSDVNFESFKPVDVIDVKKIESSKIINKRSLVPELNFEKIIKDYLFCAFRYNLSNNLKLELDIFDNNYVDMVAHVLLENIHSHHLEQAINEDDVNEKVDMCIDLHNVSANEESLEIISNIKEYWKETGSNYEILKNNIPIAFSFENCELNGIIDLVIQGSSDEKISLVQFICTDKRIDEDSVNYYQMLYHFYPFCLKEYDEFKEKEIENIFVYSLKNNNVYKFDYEESYEKTSLEFLETITTDIINAKFEKNDDSCDKCEYRSEFCKN